MSVKELASLSTFLAREVRSRSAELTRTWLDQLARRLDVRPLRVFPTEALLNHIPEVLQAVSDYLGGSGSAAEGASVRHELQQLARLRREQGYDIDEIVAEFDILSAILFAAIKEGAERYGPKVGAGEAIEVSERLCRVLNGLTAITTATFRDEGVRDRQARARLLGTFGRDLSHELRNRLGAAESALFLLTQQDVDPSTREKAVQAITTSLRRIKGVADDISALAIAQSSEETAQGRRLSLRDLLQETLKEVSPLAEELQIRLEVEEPIPEVQVDATRVELVLINLLGNAVKYSDAEKADRWVRVSARRTDDGHWRIAVSDNGVGIPAGMEELVFQEFVRANPTIADGTGLGLAIAREAIQQIGGRIWLESKAGVGTAFYFTVVDPPEAREK
jgi:signal transduction histidine kinase